MDTLQRLQTRPETIRLRGVYEVSVFVVCKSWLADCFAKLTTRIVQTSVARASVCCLQDSHNVYIVTELCTGGDLEHLLEVRPRSKAGHRIYCTSFSRASSRVYLCGELVLAKASNSQAIGSRCGGAQATGTLSEADAARVAHDVLQVLQECHRQGILYAVRTWIAVCGPAE